MTTQVLAALYDSGAADYERTRVPRFRPFVKRLLQQYDTRPYSRVLDAGCGTGLVGTMLAPRVGHTGQVVGVDASSAMLEIARHKAQGFGFDQCVFQLGDLNALEFEKETFDVLVCSFALWGEPSHLFSEFWRVLKPHGALLLQNWSPTRDATTNLYEDTLSSWRVPQPDESLRAVREVFVQHNVWWDPFKDTEIYEQALKAAGFVFASGQWYSSSINFTNATEFVEFQNVGIPRRAEIAAMSSEQSAQFTEAARATVRSAATPQGLEVEWRAIQVAARK